MTNRSNKKEKNRRPTCISISRDTRQRLRRLQQRTRRSVMDDAINSLLDFHERFGGHTHDTPAVQTDR